MGFITLVLTWFFIGWALMIGAIAGFLTVATIDNFFHDRGWTTT